MATITEGATFATITEEVQKLVEIDTQRSRVRAYLHTTNDEMLLQTVRFRQTAYRGRGARRSKKGSK